MRSDEFVKHCCYCDLIEYNGEYYRKEDYIRLTNNPQVTSGINEKHPMCMLLAGLSCSYNDKKLEDIINKFEEHKKYEPDFNIKK